MQFFLSLLSSMSYYLIIFFHFCLLTADIQYEAHISYTLIIFIAFANDWNCFVFFSSKSVKIYVCMHISNWFRCVWPTVHNVTQKLKYAPHMKSMWTYILCIPFGGRYFKKKNCNQAQFFWSKCLCFVFKQQHWISKMTYALPSHPLWTWMIQNKIDLICWFSSSCCCYFFFLSLFVCLSAAKQHQNQKKKTIGTVD